MYNATYKLVGNLLNYASMVEASTVIDQQTKHDLVVLLKAYGSLVEDPCKAAVEHVGLSRDIEIAAAQLEYLKDRAEHDAESAYSIAYVNAKHDHVGEKITEEHLKHIVLSGSNYSVVKVRLLEFKKLCNILLGMKKSLYTRGEMVKVFEKHLNNESV